MNYRLIHDEQKLTEFLDWYPELEPDETIYISLLARKKYWPNLSNTLTQLKRTTCNKKEYFISKVRQMECTIGAYKDKNNIIPNEALVLYMSTNPRSLIKAGKNTLIELARKVTENYDGYNPQSIALNEIQKADGKKHFFDFDFDGVTLEETIPQLRQIINLDACEAVVTHGGFHLLVRLNLINSEFKKSWYNNITTIKGSDVRGTSNLIPVVGACQSTFTPKLVIAADLQRM